MDDLSKRILVRVLKRRLEGRVPAHILENLSDESLLQNYFSDHQAKMDHLTKKNPAATDGEEDDARSSH